VKITVLGCGAMGGLFSAYLSRNNDVTVIDVNEALVQKINAEGMKVREPDGSTGTFRVHAALSSAGMEQADLIILFVKSLYSESALQNNRALIGKDTCLMTLQNGSGHEDTLVKFTDAEHVIIGTTQHNANITEPGTSNHGGSGITHLGCISGDFHRLQPIADVFTSCGLEADVSGDVQKMIWGKMFTNVSASALTGALQVPLGFIAADPHAWKLCEELIRETVNAARGMGMDFDAEEKIAEVKKVCENSPAGLTSIYSDLKNGRKSEVDTISGSVVRAGRKTGVPTPAHEFLVELIHAMEDRPAAARNEGKK
jgi:2-dehydropantoate 2-reductase